MGAARAFQEGVIEVRKCFEASDSRPRSCRPRTPRASKAWRDAQQRHRTL